MYLTNFIFTQTFFLTASNQIFKNGAILINPETLFQRKNSLRLYRFLIFENKFLS